MKIRLEAIANVAVILIALAAGYVVIGKYVTSYRTPKEVKVGDSLPAIPRLDWNQHRHTLVLALNTGCHFCEQSVPFYRRLVDTQPPAGNDLEIIAVFPNDSEMVRQFMTLENLPFRSVPAAPFGKLGVIGTPTLMLVGSSGRVERAWVGALSPAEESEVFNIVSQEAVMCSASEVPAPAVASQKAGCSSGITGH